MQTVLITGGAGFFGELLKKALLQRGLTCVSIDLKKDDFSHPLLKTVTGDICDTDLMESLFKKYKFDAVFHCAAILAHAERDRRFLWKSNVDGTRNIAALASRYRVPKVIFTSSNCLFGKPLNRLVTESDTPDPVEIYGRSKLEAEKILLNSAAKGDFKTVILRCPTIVSSGRLGLLAILFEFIDEGRIVWIVGSGNSIYQFIYAEDLVDACIRALSFDGTEVFNIGSDNVPTLRQVYQTIIDRAKTGSRVKILPRFLAIPAMKLAYALRLSPLGPYQYKMITESFVFDTSKIQTRLGWKPTLTNDEMLWKSYEYYSTHRNEIRKRKDVSAHKQVAHMGLIRVLKWLS